MNYTNVLVVGGAGFIGRHVVNLLAARGIRATVPTRRRDRAKHLILLPTVEVIETNVNATGVLERLVAQCDAVINLAGVLHSRPAGAGSEAGRRFGQDFFETHVELPQHIVSACRAAGVKRLLHMSALGASRGAPSEYLRSKGAGEEVVLAADDLAVTVFRPSTVFGPEDRFLNLFAKFAAITPVLAIACPDARFQPVYVGDVAQAFVCSLNERDAIGKSYDLCGPPTGAVRLPRDRPQAAGDRVGRAPFVAAGAGHGKAAGPGDLAGQRPVDECAERIACGIALRHRPELARGRGAHVHGARRSARAARRAAS
jgi:uncharacterized protein YbjT (DUF2867 family)